MTVEVPKSVDKTPLWWNDYPAGPLSSEEQGRFKDLKWVAPCGLENGLARPEFGIKRVKIGEPDRITYITKDKTDGLVKRVIVNKNEISIGLGGGHPDHPEEFTVYTNDSEVLFGISDSDGYKRIIFLKGTVLNSGTIREAINIVEEFKILTLQDKTSRKIKQAGRDLSEDLDPIIENPDIANSLVKNIDKKLEEAAVESGLISVSREELPKKIRTFPEKMKKAGIKVVEYNDNSKSFYWPDAIRGIWTPERDNQTWNEWENHNRRA